MKVLGLTGGMAAGKSTVASLFRKAGVPVFDADACVRQLQAPHGRSIPVLQKTFPGIVHDGVLDRAALRRLIAVDSTVLPRLEAIIHPLVRQERRAFLKRCRSRQVPLCVLDIPLLWEIGADRDCTLVMVAIAPLSVRLSRIRQRYRRGGLMSEADAKALLNRQMPDRERRRRADIVIKTGLSRAYAVRQVRALLASLLRERQ
ncbi:dephospho-CoA kinase [Bombella intestini]|uniref:Dephospho-CoA kinase n=1 Tax=Bombella intestini TaxID=1539051 RepID=A0A1S8GRV5_9PROT|nr:dephospho-CoA kinase [Bombella intestini]OOL19797.1 dephospho-CoA kinase [Bombella intestini]